MRGQGKITGRSSIQIFINKEIYLQLALLFIPHYQSTLIKIFIHIMRSEALKQKTRFHTFTPRKISLLDIKDRYSSSDTKPYSQGFMQIMEKAFYKMNAKFQKKYPQLQKIEPYKSFVHPLVLNKTKHNNFLIKQSKKLTLSTPQSKHHRNKSLDIDKKDIIVKETCEKKEQGGILSIKQRIEEMNSSKKLRSIKLKHKLKKKYTIKSEVSEPISTRITQQRDQGRQFFNKDDIQYNIKPWAIMEDFQPKEKDFY